MAVLINRHCFKCKEITTHSGQTGADLHCIECGKLEVENAESAKLKKAEEERQHFDSLSQEEKMKYLYLKLIEHENNLEYHIEHHPISLSDMKF